MLQGQVEDCKVWITMLSLSTRPRCLTTETWEPARRLVQGFHFTGPGIIFIAGASGIVRPFAASVGMTALHGSLFWRADQACSCFKAYNHNSRPYNILALWSDCPFPTTQPAAQTERIPIHANADPTIDTQNTGSLCSVAMVTQKPQVLRQRVLRVVLGADYEGLPNAVGFLRRNR